MISEKLMRQADGKMIYLSFFSGEELKCVKCTNFYRKEDDDEENMIEIGNIIINQSEIKSLEILDN